MSMAAMIELVGKIGFVIGLNLAFFAPVLAWVERKQSAVMQNRIGANRAAIFGFRAIGLFHSLSDLIKLIFKEDFKPRGVDLAMSRIAPVIALIPAIIAFAPIPFGGEYLIAGERVNLVVADIDMGILYVFAITSLATYGVVLGGWASNNNWSLLGAIRGSAQMFSYEVTMGLTVVPLLMYFQSLSLVEIAAKQESLLNWGIVWHWPMFFLFLACSIAENKRIPFDIPEAESELVAGYFTEYSGIKFIMFWTAEFLEMVTISALCIVLFFGGYQIPFLSVAELVALFGGGDLGAIGAALVGVGAFVVKVALFLYAQMAIRWTLPRFRYDQVMRLGWKIILPLSLAWITITGVAILTGIMPTP